ncbi:MAG: hypothetical protein JWM88_941 [Verrucomicrobia bacterium]|nr:hypothetical protein [Verrucomicrobiota bacterium]
MPVFPRRLHHDTPHWVRDGALFHIRVRVDSSQTILLTQPDLACALLQSAQSYHHSGKWWCGLFLLMPDHLHALLSFPPTSRMAMILRDWKRAAARIQGIRWQANFFDHRIRSGNLGSEKWTYIRRNPVVKGLCACEDDWPWWWSCEVPGGFSEAEKGGTRCPQRVGRSDEP